MRYFCLRATTRFSGASCNRNPRKTPEHSENPGKPRKNTTQKTKDQKTKPQKKGGKKRKKKEKCA